MYDDAFCALCSTITFLPVCESGQPSSLERNMHTIVIIVGVDGIKVKTRVKQNAQARSSPANKMKNICLVT